MSHIPKYSVRYSVYHGVSSSTRKRSVSLLGDAIQVSKQSPQLVCIARVIRTKNKNSMVASANHTGANLALHQQRHAQHHNQESMRAQIALAVFT